MDRGGTGAFLPGVTGKFWHGNFPFPMRAGAVKPVAMKTLTQLFFASVILTLGACDSIDSRIHANAPLFNSLDPTDQSKIKHGDIDLGFSPAMVYLALGAPDTKRQSASADGTTETWIYNTYYDRYEGSAHVGYRRWVVYDPGLHRYRVYWTPVYQDLYSEQKEERIRVSFRGGKVTSIDQANDAG